MINIKDLAKATGYSISTVSKAINGYSDISEKAKKKILETAEQIGYFPNSFGKNLATKKSFTVGVVFEEQSGVGLSHPFFGEVLSIIKSQIEQHGYDMLLMNKRIGNLVKSYIDHCYQKGVDGVIVISADLDKDNYQRLIESNLPMVLIDFQNKFKNTVYTNNYQATYDSVKYLYDCGHKKIAYIKGDLTRFSGRERYKGFIKAMEDFNLEIKRDYIFDGHQYLFEEGYLVAGKVVTMTNPPSAIICASDTLAIGLMRGLLYHQIRIPEDISIMGFDDIRLSSQVFPALTTVAQDKKVIGIKASQMLLDQINNPDLPVEHFVVDGIIIERETVKKIK